MRITHNLVLVTVAALTLAFVGHVFMYNLPSWCAHPERPGNWMILPLCSK